jgi:RNA polymerase sigma-70 factor (ECF subfamily)
LFSVFSPSWPGGPLSTNPSRNFFGEGHPSRYSQTAYQFPAADSDLWRRFTLGDEQALSDIYDRYSQLIYSVAHQVLNDSGTAEDVLQEVFLQLWRVPDAFEPEKGSLGAWLTVVSRRRAIDRLRKRKAEVDLDGVIVPINATQLADAARHQITDKVRALLANMPEKLRVTFELAYMQGLTHSEISERLGAPLGTTKSRIRQALDFIRKKLDCNRANTNGKRNVR